MKISLPKLPIRPAPWENTLDAVLSPFEKFIHQQTTSGIFLIAATLLAFMLANSLFAESYAHFFHTYLSVSLGNWTLSHSLHHWINDGLMALFFFLVGLEIKRELITGELSSVKKASLPIIAALGGMVMPALIYALNNWNSVGLAGWGIPMATDIAFAVTLMVLLGSRIPKGLITFLVALAIVDDLGAVAVIAIFYSNELAYIPLFSAGLMVVLMFIINRMGVHRTLPYFVLGIALWLSLLESGVHATLAGVITAFMIPARPKSDSMHFAPYMQELSHRFAQQPLAQSQPLNEEQTQITLAMQSAIDQVQSPLRRLESLLHLPVGLFIIPLFALANAGISLDASALTSSLNSPITLGVFLGLVVGKTLGIWGFSFLAIKSGWVELPQSVSFKHLFGASLLGGIGFTMSIFIADLAWIGDGVMAETASLLLEAKVGILAASLFAAISGYFFLFRLGAKANP